MARVAWSILGRPALSSAAAAAVAAPLGRECPAVQHDSSSCDCCACAALRWWCSSGWWCACGTCCSAVRRLQQLVHAGAGNALQCSMSPAAVNAVYVLHCSNGVPVAEACYACAAVSNGIAASASCHVQAGKPLGVAVRCAVSAWDGDFSTCTKAYAPVNLALQDTSMTYRFGECVT